MNGLVENVMVDKHHDNITYLTLVEFGFEVDF